MPIKELLTPPIQSYAVGLLRRLGAAFYDSLLIASLIFIVAQWSLLVAVEARQHPLFQLAMLCNIFGVAFFYLGWFWVHGGQTVGMKAWKITLVSAPDCTSISWKQALVRYVVALLSWAVLGLGFIWALFNQPKHAWHDSASNSFLIEHAAANNHSLDEKMP